MEQDRLGRPWLIATVGGVVLVVVVVAGLVMWSLAGGPETHRFTIDAGTGARIDAGEVVELMPTEVRLSVDDTLVIENDDDRDFMVGPYLVRAGETVEQTYRSPQVLVGECSLSGSGEIRIVVS